MGQKQSQKTSNNCKINCNSQTRPQFTFIAMGGLLLLVFFIFMIYSVSIKGPFVFDDTFNIRDNPKIRIENLTIDGIIKAGLESPCPNRPVANISFALNYYLNRYDVAGYHFVNILIHLIAGIILFCFVKVTLELLKHQDLKLPFEKNPPSDKQNDSIHTSLNPNISTSLCSFSPESTGPLFISFFTTFIWLVHPIQTQTISYIVQRMNGMAAMFYLLSLLCYVKARLSNSKEKKLALYLGCVISGILSLASKEIAATLPFFIILYEWYFFQAISPKWLKRNSVYLFCFLIIILFMVFFYLGKHPIEKILFSYNYRDFTLYQRVLTEFRVVIYYISLLMFPHPMQLNLLHDFTISRSFLDPTTTLISFITIAGLMVTAIFLAKRERLLSFSILWFLGNLVIESSVFNLEIIFEHRLYLPSIFFILIFVNLVHRIANSKWIGGTLLCVVVVIFSVWTYQRNIVWSDDVKLWQDCVKKSPNKPRQHYNLGVVLARNGKLDDAIEHYRSALNFKPDYVDAYYNLGNALARKGNGEDAINNYMKVVEINPDFFKAYYNIARIFYNQGKIDEAINSYQKALNINSETPQTLFNLSWIYSTSEKRRYRDGINAVKLAKKLCMLTGYPQPLALDALATAYAETGNFDKAVETAQKALEMALKLGPEEHVIELKKRLKLYQAGQPYRQS